jgi:hypothetical protein
MTGSTVGDHADGFRSDPAVLRTPVTVRRRTPCEVADIEAERIG